MSDQAVLIEKTRNGYEVFGHRFQTRDDAENFLWAESTQSKLRSEQFLWESLRDITRENDASTKAKGRNSSTVAREMSRRIDAAARRHHAWMIATVFVLASVIIASFWLAEIHSAGRWFFMTFFAWWFLMERNFWRCPACEVKIAPGLYHGATTLRKIGQCPNCTVSFRGTSD